MALDPADPIRDQGTTPKRSVIDFEVEPCEAIKFVGRWFDIDNMRFSNPTPTIGPIVMTQDDDGVQKPACMIASLNSNTRQFLP